MKVTPYKIVKGYKYLKHYGPKAFWARVQDRMEPDEVPYGPWYEKHQAAEETLIKQRKEALSLKNAPTISIVVPCYQTPEKYLIEMLESVRKQSYPYWELCLADATPTDQVEKIIAAYIDKWQENRIIYRHLEENLGIAENTNAGLTLATGDWVSFLDHDDLLALDALYEIVSMAESDPSYDVIYTDEDKVEEQKDNTLIHSQPHFKPDFSIDLLRSNNYITHFFCVKKEIAQKEGGFLPEFNGAQDYDFILRCTEDAQRIGHIARILYHWRVHSASTADNPLSKGYAYEAGRRALEEHLKRQQEKGIVSQLKFFGFYRIQYEVKNQPLISIIIPNKDECQTLKRCIESIKKTNYTNYEVIIVENNSTTEEIFQYYSELNREENMKVVTWQGEFNYSAINNYGVTFAKGEFFVLLNNDIEIITKDWLEEMLGNCQRRQVGIVGSRLYYPDNTYQHAGIVLGIDGIAANMFPGMRREREGYLHKAALQLNYSAVTAACFMIRRDIYEQVEGLEEKLAVAFNDVDLCLKVRQAGYLVVYNPYVEAYHYESKSRGKEDTKEKVQRFGNEIEVFRTKWMDILKNGDPYYNPNLSLKKTNYSLRPYNK